MSDAKIAPVAEMAAGAAEYFGVPVEESIDGVVDVLEVARTNPTFLVVAGVGGLVLGGIGGYFIAKSKLKSFYEDLATEEIAQAKEFYANVNKVGVDGGALTPADILEQRHGSEAAAAALSSYQGLVPDEEGFVEVEEGILKHIDDIEDDELLAKTESKVRIFAEEDEDAGSRNVFMDPKFDLDEEMKVRHPGRPYVISHDEYFTNEPEHEQIALTYFEEDDTLVGEDDNPVNEVDKVVGDEALVRFGHGSKDKNVVYVRNEKSEIDYEISRSDGSYLVEVLGLAPEEDSLKHSDRRNARREFRRGMG